MSVGGEVWSAGETKRTSLVTNLEGSRGSSKNVLFDIDGSRSSVSRWISHNFCRSRCRRFVPQAGSETLCQCNNPMSEHPRTAMGRASRREWDLREDTEAIPTDAFGEIEFAGYGSRMANYVCVREETDMGLMLRLFREIWEVPSPNLLISVTGGAKSFTMAPKLKKIFQVGLTKAALSTRAWIITGGMNAGVMMHVGEAIKQHNLVSNSSRKVPCIGIAPWGCVGQRGNLVGPFGKWPATYGMTEKGSLPKNEALLDDNHTHFIFVDNGTCHRYRVEIEFRARFEEYLTKTGSEGAPGGLGIPIILLVMEGGIGTLETVARSVEMGTPAVIVEGSGRAADVLAKIYRSIEGLGEGGLRQLIGEAIESEFGSQNVDTMVGFAAGCFRNMDLITVISLEGDEEIDTALLKALFTANRDHLLTQFKLALVWDKIDLVRNEATFTRIKLADMEEVLHSAILLGRTSFVQFICENGVDLRHFMTADRLVRLYNQIPPRSQLAVLLTKSRRKEAGDYVSLREVGMFIQHLMGEYFEPLYLTDPRYALLDSDLVMRSHLGKQGSAAGFEIEDPYQELFIWSVLMGRVDLAHYFWLEGKTGALAALVASTLLQRLSKLTTDYDLAASHRQCSRVYNDLAMGVINECWKFDEQRAHQVMLRENALLGKCDSLTIAVRSDNKDFVSHSCCQSLLTKIWMGAISEDTPVWQLILCNFLPCFIPLLVRFKADKPSDAATTESVSRWAKAKLLWRQIRLFYSAPVVIFMSNCFNYFWFLLLYSYVLLVEYSNQLTAVDIVLSLFIGSLFVEEVRQFLSGKNISLRTKCRDYFTNFWNLLDLSSVVIFVVGQSIRFSTHCSAANPTCFDVAKTIHSISLIISFVRLLHIFSVNKHLGPKVVMIGKMVVDLIIFAAILLVFMVSYGIIQHAILYPNSELAVTLPFTVFSKAYWQMFGELFLTEIQATEASGTCSFNQTVYRSGQLYQCPSLSGVYVIPILLGLYLIFTNALMLNLLVAMFSYTFAKIQESTDKHWCFQRYHLIHEYFNRPNLAPPFILLSHLIGFAAYFFKCCGGRPTKESEGDEFIKQLIQWENMRADDFLRTRQLELSQTSSGKIVEMEESLNEIRSEVECFQLDHKVESLLSRVNNVFEDARKQ